MRPVLHEPGPIATRYFLSGTGIPVRRGQPLRITGRYDGEHPRARVMSILHLYLAPPRGRAGPRCAPLPRDRRELLTRGDGRTDPPYEPVPFTVMDDQGGIEQVGDLPGLPAPLGAGGTVDLVGNRFSPEKVAIPVGGVLRWRFRDPEVHNVLFADGPAVVGSPTRRRGTTSARFRRPGTYRLFCPCTRSRCTRRSSSGERPMSSRDTPRPEDMTTDTTTRGGAQAARPQTDPEERSRWIALVVLCAGDAHDRARRHGRERRAAVDPGATWASRSPAWPGSSTPT